MFKIKCLIDYFLEQWWAVVLYLSQPISGLSHYWSLSFLSWFIECVCVCVCVCARARTCAHVPQGWESWRKGVFVLKVEETWTSIYSPNCTSTRIFQPPRINSWHDSQGESQRICYYADFILLKILIKAFTLKKPNSLLLSALEASSNICLFKVCVWWLGLFFF